MTAERPTFENYPGSDYLDQLDDNAAIGESVAGSTGSSGVAASSGSSAVAARSGKRGTSRRSAIGNLVAAAVGTGAVAAFVSPLLAAAVSDDDSYTDSRTFDELNAFDGFVDIGQVHSVQIINGWLAEMTGPNSAVLTRDDNQLALRTFALPADFTDAARELRAAVKRFEAVPKGAHLSSLELNSEGGYPDAYAGLVGTWRGKPAHVAVELSIREGHALLTSLWLTDGLGSRAFREGYQMMVGAIG